MSSARNTTMFVGRTSADRAGHMAASRVTSRGMVKKARNVIAVYLAVDPGVVRDETTRVGHASQSNTRGRPMRFVRLTDNLADLTVARACATARVPCSGVPNVTTIYFELFDWDGRKERR
jgi:hypothetical protein